MDGITINKGSLYVSFFHTDGMAMSFSSITFPDCANLRTLADIGAVREAIQKNEAYAAGAVTILNWHHLEG